MASENVYGVIHVFKKDGKEPVASQELRKRTFLIGRNTNCDMRILDKRISGEHCILEVMTPSGLVHLRDLTDGNALIYVNGEATHRALLCHNDILHILNRKFKFEYSVQNPHFSNNYADGSVTPDFKPAKDETGQHGRSLQTQNRKSEDAVSLCSVNLSSKRVIRSGGHPASSNKRNKLKCMKDASPKLDLSFQKQLDGISASYSEKSKKFARRKSSVSNNSFKRLKKKKVSFGPCLSPEQFDGGLPPSTPIKKGGKPNSERNSLLPTSCEGSNQSSSSSSGCVCLSILKQASSKKTARPGTPFVDCNSSASKCKSGTKGRPTSKKLGLSLALLLETESDSDAKDKLMQTMPLPSPTVSTNFHSELNGSTGIISVKRVATSVTPDIASEKCLMKDVFASSNSTNNVSSILHPKAISSITVMNKGTVSCEQYKRSSSPILTPFSSKLEGIVELSANTPNDASTSSYDKPRKSLKLTNIENKDENLISHFGLEHLQTKNSSLSQTQMSNEPFLSPSPLTGNEILTITSTDKINRAVETVTRLSFTPVSLSILSRKRQSRRLTSSKIETKSLGSGIRSQLGLNRVPSIRDSSSSDRVSEESFSPIALVFDNKSLPRLSTNENQNIVSANAGSCSFKNNSLTEEIASKVSFFSPVEPMPSTGHVPKFSMGETSTDFQNPAYHSSLKSQSESRQSLRLVSLERKDESFDLNVLHNASDSPQLNVSPTSKELSLSPIDSMLGNIYLSKSSPEKANDHAIIHSSYSKSQYSVNTCEESVYDCDVRSMTHHSTPVSHLASKPRLFNTTICEDKNSDYTGIKSKERPIKEVTPSAKVENHEKSSICMVDFDVIKTAASSIPPVISSDDCLKTRRKNLNKKQASLEVSSNKIRVLRTRNISQKVDRIDVMGMKDTVKLQSRNAQKQRPENCQKKSKGFSSEITEGNKTEECFTQIGSSKQTEDKNVKGIEPYKNSPDFSLINSKNERKQEAHSVDSHDLDMVHEKYTRNKQTSSKAAIGNYEGLRSRKTCQKVKIDPELSDIQRPSIDAKLPKKRAQVQKCLKYQKKSKASVNENSFEKQNDGISTRSSKLNEDKVKQTEICNPLKDFPVTEERKEKKPEANSLELDNSGILKKYAGKKRMSPKVANGNCRTLRSKKASENGKIDLKHPNVYSLNTDATVQKKATAVKKFSNYQKPKTSVNEISDRKKNVSTRITRRSKLNGIEVKQTEHCSDLKDLPLTGKGNKRKLKTKSLESHDSSPILEMYTEEVQAASKVSIRKCRSLRSRVTPLKEAVDAELSHAGGSKSNAELEGKKAHGKKPLSDEKNNKAKGKTLALRGGKIPGSLPLSCKTNKRGIEQSNKDLHDTYEAIENFSQFNGDAEKRFVSTETKPLRTRSATSTKVKTSAPNKENELSSVNETKNQKRNLRHEKAKLLKYARTDKGRTSSVYLSTGLTNCESAHVLKKETESPANKRITRAARKHLIHV